MRRKASAAFGHGVGAATREYLHSGDNVKLVKLACFSEEGYSSKSPAWLLLLKWKCYNGEILVYRANHAYHNA